MPILAQVLAPMAASQDREAVRQALAGATTTLSSVSLKPAGLVIKTASSPLAKIGAADYYASVNGTIVRIAASTDMPGIPDSPAITAGQYLVAAFYVNAAAVVTAAVGTIGSSAATARFPTQPPNTALVGWLLITTSAAYIPGSSPLDGTTTTVYFDGNSFNPSATA